MLGEIILFLGIDIERILIGIVGCVPHGASHSIGIPLLADKGHLAEVAVGFHLARLLDIAHCDFRSDRCRPGREIIHGDTTQFSYDMCRT